MPLRDENNDKDKKYEDIDLDSLPSIEDDKEGGEPAVVDIKAEQEAEDKDKKFNVFLSRPGDLEKYDIATDLLTQILGIPEDKAAELIERPIVAVAKGIERKQAEKIVAMFRDRGVFAKMTEKKR